MAPKALCAVTVPCWCLKGHGGVLFPTALNFIFWLRFFSARASQLRGGPTVSHVWAVTNSGRAAIDGGRRKIEGGNRRQLSRCFGRFLRVLLCTHT